MTIRELVNVIGFEVDDNQLKKADGKFKNIMNSSKKMIKNFMLVGSAISGVAFGIHKFTEKIVKTADEIAKTARDIGISGEALQEWRYAADKAGISSEELTTNLNFFTKGLINAAGIDFNNLTSGIDGTSGSFDDAITGSGRMAESFKILKIGLDDGTGKIKDNNTLLFEMADKFKEIKDPALKAKIATDLFGRSGIRMSQFLSQGSESLKKLGMDAHKIGKVIGEETLGQAEVLNDMISKLKSTFQGFGYSLGAMLIPIVTEFVAKLQVLFLVLKERFDGLKKDIKPLIQTIFSLANAFLQILLPVAEEVIKIIRLVLQNTKWLFTAIKMLIPIILGLVKTFSGLIQVLAFLSPIIAGIAMGFLAYKTVLLATSTATKIAAVATKAWTIAQWAFNAAMLANPANLIMLGIVAAVGLLIAAFLLIKKNWDYVSAGITEGFRAVANLFKTYLLNPIIKGINFLISAYNKLPFVKKKVNLIAEMEVSDSEWNKKMKDIQSKRDKQKDFEHQEAMKGLRSDLHTTNSKVTNMQMSNQFNFGPGTDKQGAKKGVEIALGKPFQIDLRKVLAESY